MNSPVITTPVVTAADYPAVYFKLECNQPTGSFKLRGAWRKVMSMRHGLAGVVCASAGNHGAGVAFAARARDMPCTVVVPVSTPEFKRARIRSFGGKVLVRGVGYDEAEACSRQLAKDQKLPFISPFDDDEIIAGNGGSLAQELLLQVANLRRVVAPVGGGGLLAGLAQELCHRGVEVLGVQPESNCAMHESLKLGRALTHYVGGATCAGGCEGAVAERTFAIVHANKLKIQLVSEQAIREAIRFCDETLGVHAEATGAVAVAGLRSGLVEAVPATVVIISGGRPPAIEAPR